MCEDKFITYTKRGVFYTEEQEKLIERVIDFTKDNLEHFYDSMPEELVDTMLLHGFMLDGIHEDDCKDTECRLHEVEIQ